MQLDHPRAPPQHQQPDDTNSFSKRQLHCAAGRRWRAASWLWTHGSFPGSLDAASPPRRASRHCDDSLYIAAFQAEHCWLAGAGRGNARVKLLGRERTEAIAAAARGASCA